VKKPLPLPLRAAFVLLLVLGQGVCAGFGPPQLAARDFDSTALWPEQVRELVSKGAIGGAIFLTTDDAQTTFETLKGRGVDITDEPAERPYGIDFGIRDPFGNAIRIGQMFDTGLTW